MFIPLIFGTVEIDDCLKVYASVLELNNDREIVLTKDGKVVRNK